MLQFFKQSVIEIKHVNKLDLTTRQRSHSSHKNTKSYFKHHHHHRHQQQPNPKTIIMKISVALLSAFLASSEAFSPISRYAGRTTTTNLYNARADTADMVQEALDASKKFGATSKEAMLAWEAVEEVDASDNR